jgi:FAD/FMN-containing dehydrogenase
MGTRKSPQTNCSLPNKEMFRAVAGNFGCFGVIFDMTIQLVPEIIVKTENLYYDLEDIFFNPASMKSLVENNWSVEIFWFLDYWL